MNIELNEVVLQGVSNNALELAAGVAQVGYAICSLTTLTA
jgi:hypothetical protein